MGLIEQYINYMRKHYSRYTITDMHSLGLFGSGVTAFISGCYTHAVFSDKVYKTYADYPKLNYDSKLIKISDTMDIYGKLNNASEVHLRIPESMYKIDSYYVSLHMKNSANFKQIANYYITSVYNNIKPIYCYGSVIDGNFKITHASDSLYVLLKNTKKHFPWRKVRNGWFIFGLSVCGVYLNLKILDANY